MAKVARPAAEKQAATSLELITNLARLYWDDVADRITALVRPLVEEFLEARRTELLGAGAWERTDVRTGHRGGSYAGVCRPAGARWSCGSRVLPSAPTTWRSSTAGVAAHAEVDQIIGKLFLAGVSTRRLERVGAENSIALHAAISYS